MDIEQMTRGQIEAEFAALARTMYFTKSTIAAFSKDATRGQLVAACELIRSENATREENRKARLMRQAKFPAVKSVADFDFGEVTHLSIALGVLAAERGYKVRYFETASLVLMLKAAVADNRLEQVLRDIAKADLLIIDEYGYIPIDIEGARLLYQVMSATYETRSMIVTTNIEFGKWGTVLGDAHLATATIDRIMHHGRLVEFGGQSRRFEEALMMGRSDS